MVCTLVDRTGRGAGEIIMALYGLKPCPFCGENEQTEFLQVWNGKDDFSTYHIRCDYCGALGPENSKSFKIAWEEWNGRKP